MLKQFINISKFIKLAIISVTTQVGSFCIPLWLAARQFRPFVFIWCSCLGFVLLFLLPNVLINCPSSPSNTVDTPPSSSDSIIASFNSDSSVVSSISSSDSSSSSEENSASSQDQIADFQTTVQITNIQRSYTVLNHTETTIDGVTREIYQTTNEQGISNVIAFVTIYNVLAGTNYHLTESHDAYYNITKRVNILTDEILYQTSNIALRLNTNIVTNDMVRIANQTITNIEKINTQLGLNHPNQIANWSYRSDFIRQDSYRAGTGSDQFNDKTDEELKTDSSLLYSLSEGGSFTASLASMTTGSEAAIWVTFDTNYYVVNIEYAFHYPCLQPISGEDPWHFAGIHRVGGCYWIKGPTGRNPHMVVQVKYWDQDTWSTIGDIRHSIDLVLGSVGSVAVNNIIKEYRVIYRYANSYYIALYRRHYQRFDTFLPSFLANAYSASDIKDFINRFNAVNADEGIDDGVPFVQYYDD